MWLFGYSIMLIPSPNPNRNNKRRAHKDIKFAQVFESDRICIYRFDILFTRTDRLIIIIIIIFWKSPEIQGQNLSFFLLFLGEP